jgi:hypothetical protein
MVPPRAFAAIRGPRAAREVDERVAGDHQRGLEVLARGVDEAALELVLVGEGDRVDEDVEPAPAAPISPEGAVERGVVGDVRVHEDLGPTWRPAAGRAARKASPW